VSEPGPGKLVLGIDTSTTVNVGLAWDGEVLTTGSIGDSRAHVEQLMPLVQQCLTDGRRQLREIDQIVVGLGPGPFTGLRVGIVTARVLAAALPTSPVRLEFASLMRPHHLSLPLHGICSLDVLAAQHVRDAAPALGGFLVATDARRREVYWARYDPAGRRVAGPYVNPPAELPRLPTVGPAVHLYPDRLLGIPGPRSFDPGVLATRGPNLPTAGSEPLYLRRADAAEPSRRKPVLAHRPPRARG
jgi:tRNA threonylcarbamoyl adenosine modification protein YeaZ